MILKIERYKGDQRWWLIDDVKRIGASLRMKYETQVQRKEVLAGGPDLIFLDLLTCNCNPERDACDKCIDYEEYGVCRLNCRMNDGSDYSVVFDTIVYVLNDSGKTIEKIVANYKE
jgi:hypothetical protein